MTSRDIWRDGTLSASPHNKHVLRDLCAIYEHVLRASLRYAIIIIIIIVIISCIIIIVLICITIIIIVIIIILIYITIIIIIMMMIIIITVAFTPWTQRASGVAPRRFPSFPKFLSSSFPSLLSSWN